MNIRFMEKPNETDRIRIGWIATLTGVVVLQ